MICKYLRPLRLMFFLTFHIVVLVPTDGFDKTTLK